MEIEKVGLKDVFLIKPSVYEDERGYFFEPFNQNRWKETTGLDCSFVQDNESFSKANVLRGLHFQIPPMEQGKLVRVTRGEATDVIVDLRKSSPTFLKHFAVKLSAENKIQMWIPPGFAHGFITHAEPTVFSYKCTQFYSKDHEESLRWDDPELNIDWGTSNPILSSKDSAAQTFSQFINPFE